MMPKTKAPTGRMASVAVSVQVSVVRVSPKAFATSESMNVRTKKSNASKVQPKKLAPTAYHWSRRSAAASAVLMN